MRLRSDDCGEPETVSSGETPFVSAVSRFVCLWLAEQSEDVGAGEREINRKCSGTPLFDGLGSERTVTNSSQAVTGTLTQDGFGNTVASTGSSNPYMYAATSKYK